MFINNKPLIAILRRQLLEVGRRQKYPTRGRVTRSVRDEDLVSGLQPSSGHESLEIETCRKCKSLILTPGENK